MRWRVSYAALLAAAIIINLSSAATAATSANVAWGVDFGNMTYANTPCEKSPAKMRDGKYTYPALVATEGTDIDASIQQVSQGQVGGARLAVVVFQCAPPKGCYNEARAYLVNDSKAVQLGGKLASLYDGCPDPINWFHVRFTPTFLFADVHSQGDTWIVTTYRFTKGKLVEAFVQRHKLHTPIRP
ncbi:MAG TPA: hypothetical protein VFO29_08070 [Candidatus Rubrimentiphilum sp.]|nr:hypothetical protein [Candidatus Rubrimentiphilum sp.]